MNKTQTIAGLTALLLVVSTVSASDEHKHHRPKGLGSAVVTAVTPLANSTGVPINTKIITAAFGAAVNPDALNEETFTLVCPAGTPIEGEVTYLATGNVATLTLPAETELPANTLCTATVGKRAHHREHAGKTTVSPSTNFSWKFTTGVLADSIRPGVSLAVPVIPMHTALNAATVTNPIIGVPSNTAITAVFTKDMAPATINSASFTVTCAAPCNAPAGTVNYVVASRTAVFTPDVPLNPDTSYTVTITTAATDLAGNSLAGNQAPLPTASNYVQTIVTAGPVPSANASVLSTLPANAAVGVCPSASVNATFDVPTGLRIDPLSVTAATFSVTGPAPSLAAIPAASVTLDVATGHIATFTPLNPLAPGIYTATINSGASGIKDLAIPANTLVSNSAWNFTVATPASAANCLTPISLGSASLFGDFGGSAGMTNSGVNTTINGNIGTIAVATSSITGFHDTAGDIYTETPLNIGTVNGLIYTCTNSSQGPTATGPNAASCAIAKQAELDAETAFNALTALPAGPDPGAGNLGGLTLAPGVYTAAAATFMIEGGDLILDAKGDANAVWVFQMATSLTVGGPGAAKPQSVILTNGAQAKNVFWKVGSAATINAGGGGTMVGTIISPAGATFSTAGNTAPVTLNGRVLSLGASTTMVNTVINVPAP